MQGDVVLLGDDLVYLTELSLLLQSLCRTIVISSGRRPARRALRGGMVETDAAVVCLDDDNVADVRELIGAHPDVAFLFISKTAPPHAAMAHAVRSSGAVILPRSDGPVVVTVTLVAMMAQRSAWMGLR